MKKRITYCTIGMLFIFCSVFGQKSTSLEFKGQISAVGNYSPDNELDVFTGIRYIPELRYTIPVDSTKLIDFEAAANISGSSFIRPFDSATTDGTLRPYRLWARYSGRQFEIRAGLQKIDFGSATLLRPLQWFNEIDPRDPLQLTNGVYGLLGRYYFLNNANIWLWGLWRNEKRRGFDVVNTYQIQPEFGGRIQHPTPRGEIALSYHHRTADSRDLTSVPSIEQIPENRIGLDGKWDIKIGLWFEASYIHKSKDVGDLTNQALLNVGTDYTFGVGNGLNVVLEHLFTSFDRQAFEFKNTAHITALSLSYPFGLWDNLNAFTYFNWPTKEFTYFLNFQHQFKKITGYIMASYNPKNQQGIQQNELVNQFAGPGIRIMAVYNY
ncbi:hypothetical protein [Membranihabitans marinus]|nr:hypothetical protein [Membranihabitans marinus]